MDSERFRSAYRVGLGIALIYIVVWMLVPRVLSYSRVVVGGARQSQKVNAPREPKLSAPLLEAALRRTDRFGPNSRLNCEPAARDWDYVCSYLPTPLESTTRLQFGVSVDAARWVSVSRVVPMGTIVPPPE